FDETANEVIVLDWSLTARLNREDRRQVGRLIMAMIFRDQGGVLDAILALSHSSGRADPATGAIVDREVKAFFASLPFVASLTTMDAMRLLELVGVAGVRFPASLVMVRKVLFTLDGVLHDVIGGEVRLDNVISREFVARFAKPSLPPPFGWTDYLAVQLSAFRYATGMWALKSA
ncbi:MAG TPA: hypothetical protein DEH78_07060, partial [Solibacterales bacterium]|nr:hypothetical protein [Bryobacterales bacterium]